MRILAFLKSPLGNLVLLVAFVAVGGLLVYRSNVREKAQAAQMTSDRQRDDTTGEYGLRDGSAGLVGELLRTDNLQEI